MKIFAPYVVQHQSNQELHLILPKGWVRFKTFFFRGFPFVLAILLIIAAINATELPALLMAALVISIVLVIILLFIKVFSTELHIKKESIEVGLSTWKGLVHQQIPIASIEHLICKVRYGRGGGAFFSMALKDGKRISLIDIPIMYLDKEHTLEASTIFTSLTGLQVMSE